ncbi:MAG: FG-GAP repeat protein, partial [Chromatiaceae bacterium]|nr:FG-GAP repeat protein [Chromatiaceae bacterium]
PRTDAQHSQMRRTLAVSIGLTALVGLLPLSGAWAGYVEQKLTPTDRAQGDYFGSAVAIDGDKVLIGASGSEAAYLFDAQTGAQSQKFTQVLGDQSTSSLFGSAVAIDGDRVLIGDHMDDGTSGAEGSLSYLRRGSAYLFNANTGALEHQLTASDAAKDDLFGKSVAISGDYVVIGAEGKAFYNSDENNYSWQAGAAYLFDATTGQELAKLTASDAAQGDYFGGSVAIDGDYILVGAHGDDDHGNVSGAAYLFKYDASTSTLSQLHKFTDSGSLGLGSSVAIEGNSVLIGSYEPDRRGAVYQFAFDDTSYNLVRKLTASDAAYRDSFGGSIALDGGKALIGAAGDDDKGGDSGSAYLFDITTGDELHKFTASDGVSEQDFGGSVALSGDRLVMGAEADWETDEDGIRRGGYGAAYLYTTQTTPPPSNVPTPSTLALMLAAGLGLVVSGRRLSGGARGRQA